MSRDPLDYVPYERYRESAARLAEAQELVTAHIAKEHELAAAVLRAEARLAEALEALRPFVTDWRSINGEDVERARSVLSRAKGEDDG